MTEPAHQAMLFERLDGESVRCELCGHRCQIAAGEFGICRVRQNEAGTLRSLNYQSVVAAHVDPIEKKPLFHFLPGTRSLSIAAPGCNFQCEFCQNWQISQTPRNEHRIDGRPARPDEIVAAAEEHRCASISYTYTEPTVFFELAYDTAKLAHERGIRGCFVSNGYLTPRAVETIEPYIDAINVDLKAFRDETYRRIMKARLEPVLTCLRALSKTRIWVEITTLIVPEMNDSAEELGEIAAFIADELGPHVPWHVSRFHGDYKMASNGRTPIETMEMACRLGREAGLKYVYSGNAPGQADEKTHCPSCGEIVIDRTGFVVRRVTLEAGKCPSCGAPIEGIWG